VERCVGLEGAVRRSRSLRHGGDRDGARTRRRGAHIVASDDLYGGTYRLFERSAAQCGLSFTFVDMTDPAKFAALCGRDAHGLGRIADEPC